MKKRNLFAATAGLEFGAAFHAKSSTAPATATHAQPFVLIAQFRISPGREEQLRTRALAFAQMAQQAAPGVLYRLHVHPDRSGKFVFYEFFPSRAAYDKVQTDVVTAHRAVHGPTPAGMFAAAPVEQEWRPLN